MRASKRERYILARDYLDRVTCKLCSYGQRWSDVQDMTPLQIIGVEAAINQRRADDLYAAALGHAPKALLDLAHAIEPDPKIWTYLNGL